MWHRKPEKYKEFEGMKNIIHGMGEMSHIKTPDGRDGWVALDGNIIYDRNAAELYAKKIDALFRFNKLRNMRELTND
jgi:hypothetical protein